MTPIICWVSLAIKIFNFRMKCIFGIKHHDNNITDVDNLHTIKKLSHLIMVIDINIYSKRRLCTDQHQKFI